MQHDKISEAVIRRLPRYYRHLGALVQRGVVRISSQLLADNLGLTASQIRQDLNCFGGFGQQGYGYNVELLHKRIGEILHGGRTHTAILIGVGNLGRALCENFNFMDAGVSLTAAFDVRPELFGATVGGVIVHNVETLDEYVREHTPSIAVLTLPRKNAAAMTHKLCSLGVRGLWNFTNEDIHQIAENVVIENIHFFDSLMYMCYHLKDEQI